MQRTASVYVCMVVCRWVGGWMCVCVCMRTCVRMCVRACVCLYKRFYVGVCMYACVPVSLCLGLQLCDQIIDHFLQISDVEILVLRCSTLFTLCNTAVKSES